MNCNAQTSYGSHTQKGFSLVELCVVTGILSFIMVAIMELNGQIVKQQQQSVSLVQIDTYRRNIIALILSNYSWGYSINSAINMTSMQCLRTGTPCTEDGTAGGQPIQNRSFALYDGANPPIVIFDATNATHGLTFEGILCSAFSITGNDACPFRFNLQWSAVCSPGNCVNPMVKVSGALLFSPSNSLIRLNPANYSVPDLYRPAQ